MAFPKIDLVTREHVWLSGKLSSPHQSAFFRRFLVRVRAVAFRCEANMPSPMADGQSGAILIEDAKTA
jgi:hypothetical protein